MSNFDNNISYFILYFNKNFEDMFNRMLFKIVIFRFNHYNILQNINMDLIKYY